MDAACARGAEKDPWRGDGSVVVREQRLVRVPTPALGLAEFRPRFADKEPGPRGLASSTAIRSRRDATRTRPVSDQDIDRDGSVDRPTDPTNHDATPIRIEPVERTSRSKSLAESGLAPRAWRLLGNIAVIYAIDEHHHF